VNGVGWLDKRSLTTYSCLFFTPLVLILEICLSSNTWRGHTECETSGGVTHVRLDLTTWFPLLRTLVEEFFHYTSNMSYSPNGKGSSGLLPPVSVLTNWPLPNYDDPVTRSKAVLITSCALGSVMLATVGARLWARAVIQRNSGIDDWLMLAAMVRTPHGECNHVYQR
jgi:hypothetical protein